MPVPGIEFRTQRPFGGAATTRADVAVFAGLVARRPGPLPAGLRSALAAAGWRAKGSYPVTEPRLTALLGVPVPVEGWAEFDALFDWRSRASVPGAGPVTWAGVNLCEVKSVVLKRDPQAGAWVDYDE
jgi:hypothetical protein